MGYKSELYTEIYLVLFTCQMAMRDQGGLSTSTLPTSRCSWVISKEPTLPVWSRVVENIKILPYFLPLPKLWTIKPRRQKIMFIFFLNPLIFDWWESLQIFHFSDAQYQGRGVCIAATGDTSGIARQTVFPTLLCVVPVSINKLI